MRNILSKGGSAVSDMFKGEELLRSTKIQNQVYIGFYNLPNTCGKAPAYADSSCLIIGGHFR